MIPGIQSKLSTSTVASTTSVVCQTDIMIVTGTTAIATISPPGQGGFESVMFVIPTSGNVNLTTAGNIAVAVTATSSQVTLLVWSNVTSKWHPNI